MIYSDLVIMSLFATLLAKITELLVDFWIFKDINLPDRVCFNGTQFLFDGSA